MEMFTSCSVAKTTKCELIMRLAYENYDVEVTTTLSYEDYNSTV